MLAARARTNVLDVKAVIIAALARVYCTSVFQEVLVVINCYWKNERGRNHCCDVIGFDKTFIEIFHPGTPLSTMRCFVSM
jgi:hypothetical protein